MKQSIKKGIAFLIAFVFAFTGAFMFNGTGTFVYGESGGDTDSQDATYSQDGGILGAIGIDTSVVPETYDPDNTSNPYGSDVINLSEMSELVKIDTRENTPQSYLYGHNKKLDGSYDSLVAGPMQKPVPGPDSHAYVAADNCDVHGSGRDSAVAMLYCNYRYSSGLETNDTGTIYMKIYDPKSGESTDPFVITDNVESFVKNQIEWNYLAQSQLQIAAGDFDNDTVEEIAVYVPAAAGSAPRIAIYDLTNGGTNSANPYNKAAWQNVWNYVLPKTTAQIVECDPPQGHAGDERFYISNFYNNIDLAAGDADNDGSCDLVVSYGASSVYDNGRSKQEIIRSLPSKSVILYGSNGSDSHGVQMLRDSQNLQYGDDNLIRVSFGFGDLDGDGNEDLIMGGQRQADQSDNSTRVLARFSYNGSSGGMISEGTQNMDIISGQWVQEGEDDSATKSFSSSNGWDGYYHSMPAMNTNVAVGKIYGQSSNVRIYMDSVLYSYDSTFEIVDEMEDPSPADPNDKNGKKKGSAVFTDMKGVVLGEYEQLDYYEYGASIGNYTASAEDYLIVQRVSELDNNPAAPEKKFHADASLLVPVSSDDDDEVHTLTVNHNTNRFKEPTQSGPETLLPADTDMDSCVATYTGQHEIQYQKPKILAVIASAPYFKDVADYDESGDMLAFSETSYGSSTGKEDEYSQTVSYRLGIYSNNDVSFGTFAAGLCDFVGININAALGYQWSEEFGHSVNKSFDVTYGAAAGEDQVVLYSTPTENYTYNVTTGQVDEDGNVSVAQFVQTIPDPHEPVTQVIPLDRYKKIMKTNKAKLPDVTKYLTSKPGDPSSYPKSVNDIPQTVTDSWANVTRYQYAKYAGFDEYDKIDNSSYIDMMVDHPFDDDMLDEYMQRKDYTWYEENTWEGAGFGNGYISQTLSAEHNAWERTGGGAYFDLEVGAHFKSRKGWGIFADYETNSGIQFNVDKNAGMKYSHSKGVTCSGTVANMPRSAENYGYDFSWNLLEYSVHDSDECIFPVVTYMVTDIQSPPKLPESITQDFDQTTDSQVCLKWTYTDKEPLAFDLYRYKDFPQGGGDELVASIAGSDYQVRKDTEGNTITNSDGKPIKEYTFIEDGLTADTKYHYRMKVRANTPPFESIFSPIIEARTDVSEKPALSLSTDKLVLYPDGQYNLTVNLADPEHYETSMDYQWQKYNTKTLKWEDIDGKTKNSYAFTECKQEQAGQYRCRVNLVRKHESSPQYISAYTNICEVSFSMRDVKFDPIAVFEGTGSSFTNTGIMVGVKNASASSTTKPSGTVKFHLTGPNGTLTLDVPIDQATGIARLDSIEDELSSVSQEGFVNGGYLVTAEYEGDQVFKPAEDKEEYHYLRNIEACDFLSMQSLYCFGQDVIPTTNLFRYTMQDGGAIKKEDITDTMTTLKLYTADENGQKGDLVTTINLSDTSGVAQIPLNAKLKKRTYVEAYVSGSDEAVAFQVVKVAPKKVSLTLSGKVSGGGELLKLYSFDDVKASGDCDLTEKNMVSADGGDAKSLEDLLVFKYYEDSGSYMFDSTEAESHKSEFIPARYKVDIAAKDKDSKALYETFYSFNNPSKAEFLIVGSYYEVTAASSDEAAGSVRLIAPFLKDDVSQVGFPGGTKITLKALPSPGFRIKKWVINDGQGGTQTQNGGDLLIYTLRSDPTLNSDGQVGVTAVFEPKNQTLTYEAKGDGTISVNPFFSSGSTVLEGTQMQFTAQANDGWHFKEWRWTNFGGNTSVSQGTAGENAVNSKTYTMGDNPAAVYAVFFRDTINIDLDDHLNASYINDGSNPLEDTGEEIAVTNGKDVPKGTTVRVVTAPGYEPAKDAEWIVNVTTPDGTSQVEVEEIMAGGSDGCEFKLPDDVTACSVQLETAKGYYALGLAGTGVKYVVSLDGSKVPESQYQQMLQRIEGGTLVEVQAIPDRGKLFDHWMIDGVASEDAPQTYSFTLQDSVSLQAAVKEDEAHTIKLKGTGNGTGLYTITGHEGEVVSENFGQDEVQVTAYKGERLTICDDPDDLGYILTAVKMNGERQDLVEGVFTLENITEDAEFVCSFQPTTYCTISFENQIEGDVQPELLDGDGNDMDFGDTVDIGSGEDLSFSVIMDKNYPCHVRDKGELIKPESTEGWGDSTKYNYKYNVKETTTLTIDDLNEYTISNWEEFDQFMREMDALNGAGGRPTATITADITMPDGAELPRCTGAFRGTLDGQGHTISGLKLEGENGAPFNGESALFGSIAKGGVVKNLVIDGYEAYVQQRIGTVDEGDTRFGNALITRINHGTISGVTLKDCTLRQHTLEEFNPDDPFKPEIAGIAAYNTGAIEACAVTGLKLKASDRDYMDSNVVGCAVTLKSHLGNDKGTVIGCYVEGLQIASNGDYIDATDLIIANDSVSTGSGLFLGNYFRVYGTGPSGDSSRGNNVTTITDDPDDVTFAGNLAYHINHETEEDLWGIHKPAASTGNGVVTPEIIPMAYGGDDCKAPVRAKFSFKDTNYELYLYPDQWKLPGREKFGDDEELCFWKIGMDGTTAYSIGYDSVEILKDTTFIGVKALEGGVAQLYGEDDQGNKTGIICYSDLDEAFAAAEATDLESPHLDIVGDCTMNNKTFTVGSGMVMTVCDGVAFTMGKKAQISNKGTFTCAEGGTLHKYGSMNNAGTINVDGTFINYGSKLKNTGENAVINNRDKIQCEPHLLGEWQSADHPDADGKWTSTATCEVCEKEFTETIDPNPEADEISSIDVFRYPTKAEYRVGEAFDDSGLMIAATLKSGLMAKITDYTMTITDGTAEPVPITDGDILDHHGAMQVAVNYKGFKCEFPIVVRSSVTGIAIADGGRDVAKGENLQLEAVITPPDAQVNIQWTSEDENIATVDGSGRVTGVAGGQAKITATVDDMSASCTITVHEAATSLELDEYDILVPQNGNELIAARVAPATADSEITWTVADPTVAGIRVTDEETGETTVEETATTKLSAGKGSEASSYIAVAGVGAGETEITASVKDDRGLTIHKVCKVEVRQADEWVRLIYDGAAVSGKTVQVDATKETISFRAESSLEDDTLDWSAVDDEEDPVITVEDNGKITLNRSGSAAVRVTSDVTGLSDVCILHVVTIPTTISLSASDIHIAKGVVKMLTATVSPEKMDGDIEWISSNKKVATVSKGGVITGTGEGKAIITAQTTADPNVKATCQITVYDPVLQVTLSKDTFYYNGKVKTPAVTVTSGSQILAQNTTQSNNRVLIMYEGGQSTPGTQTVTAIGRDEGMGVASATYKIIVKPTKLKKLKGKKKAIRVKWSKKKKTEITGYQIQVATDKKFKKNKKTKTIKKYKKGKTTLKKLKKKKVYYVRVRTFKRIGDRKYYSPWSPVKKVRTK